MGGKGVEIFKKILEGGAHFLVYIVVVQSIEAEGTGFSTEKEIVIILNHISAWCCLIVK